MIHWCVVVGCSENVWLPQRFAAVVVKLNMTVKYFQFVDTKTFCAPKLLSLSHSLPLSLVVSFSFGLSIYCYWLLAPVGNLLTENKSFWSSECQTFKWRTFSPAPSSAPPLLVWGCPLVGLRQGVQFIRLDLCVTFCINVWALITFPSVSLSFSLLELTNWAID